MKRILMLLVVLFVLIGSSSAHAANNWPHVVEKMEAYLDQTIQAYEQGDVEKAKELLNEAYYGPFESERMEQAIRSEISSKRAAELEFDINSIRKKMTAGASVSVVKEEMSDLRGKLRADAQTLQDNESGPTSLFFYSLLILVREGAEAILIIAAIAAYLVKSGNQRKTKEVYQSAFAALLASLVTAYLFKTVLKVSGTAQEALEGGTLIFAMLMLLSMSYWLIRKANVNGWKHYIEGMVKDSVGNGKRFALWTAVFLAVYREGAETVLFYQALIQDSSGSSTPVWLGILLGAVVLVVLFYFVRFGSVRLPIRPFFMVSGLLLYVLAFIFAGEGIKELQAAGWSSWTPIEGFASIGMLGIYPSWEGIGIQAFVLLLLLTGIAFKWLNTKRRIGQPVTRN